MRINCPFCGERDSGEFTYSGASVRRPALDGADCQTRFFEAVYLRDNPAGINSELWYHVFGCRSWLRVVRHTHSHRILAVEFASEVTEP